MARSISDSLFQIVRDSKRELQEASRFVEEETAEIFLCCTDSDDTYSCDDCDTSIIPSHVASLNCDNIRNSQILKSIYPEVINALPSKTIRPRKHVVIGRKEQSVLDTELECPGCDQDAHKFSQQESELLQNAVLRFGRSDWSRVATTINSHKAMKRLHSSWACMKQYLSSIQTPKLNLRDQRIITKFAKAYGEGAWGVLNEILFTEHRYLLAKGSTALGKHYEQSVKKRKSNIQKQSRWTLAEDQKLICAAKVYRSLQWSLICKHIPGKTDKSCRQRFYILSSCGSRVDSRPGTGRVIRWNEMANNTLRELASSYSNGKGIQWKKIAAVLNKEYPQVRPRSVKVCRAQFFRLCKISSEENSFDRST